MEVRRVHIDKLAPTGEGVARGAERVGFVDGSLPGEEVDAEVSETRSRFWRGRTVAVHVASPHRRPLPEGGCGGCDWAHFDGGAALHAKRALFLETMGRIGRLRPEGFGELPVVPSPLGYRLRNRFHVSGRGGEALIGAFAVRSHRLTPAFGCAALPDGARAALGDVAEALKSSSAAAREVATLEDREGKRRVARVILERGGEGGTATLRALGDRLASSFGAVRFEGADGRRLLGDVGPRVTIRVGGRTFSAAADAFFQPNRFAVEDLYAWVRDAAGALPSGQALDAFGGVGLLAGALLDAGHRVVSVEGDRAASREAARNRASWGDGARWRLVASSVAAFTGNAPAFRVVVADPPRAGLGELAVPLARLATETLLYVSCEPATLARDLPPILAQGFTIRDARLLDMFPLTHRLEALVALARR